MTTTRAKARGRGAKASKSSASTPPPTITRRIAWIVAAAIWAFCFVSLASFSPADPPSHTVAVHSAEIANLCGLIGAYVAYWCYYIMGIGVWVLLLALGTWLGICVSGRSIDHLALRSIGVALTAITISCLHQLIFPETGPMAGAPAGLVAYYVVSELVPRFSSFGTGLILLVALTVGMLIAADQVVFRSMSLIGRGLRSAGQLRNLELPAWMRRADRPRKKTAKSKPRKRKRRATSGHWLERLFGWFPYRIARADQLASAGGHRGIAPELDEEDDYEYVDEYEDGDVDEEDGAFEYEDEYEDGGEYEDEEDEDEYEDEEEDEYEDDDEYEEEEEEELAPSRRRLTAAQLREKISKLPLRIGSSKKTVAKDEDIPREESFEGYKFPELKLLAHPETGYTKKQEALVRKQAQQLEEALRTYNIDGEVVGIESGPSVSLYSVQLAPGTKVRKLSEISSDLARSVRAQNIRIVSNMIGKTTVGIEVPNLKREKVRLKELMNSKAAEGMNLPMFLGKDAAGDSLVADLTKMPHMLIAGTTGSGKSVCMNSILMSWLYTKRPDELKLILVDPKMVELSQFGDIPHLMCPVVTEMSRAAGIVEWAVKKMEERYDLFRKTKVRDIAGYNQLTEEELFEAMEPANDKERALIPKKLPFIVFVIDELADLILTHKEVEQAIVRIAQKARAVGIHLILATQRPQANVVTGLIKSNMPCRVSFKVASNQDSRIVLDQKGAELLLGQGDMLFVTPQTTELRRAQATLVDDAEIRKVTKFVKSVAAPNFERSLIAIKPGQADVEPDGIDRRDDLFDEAVRIIIETGRGSVSLLQRRLAIGYSRASRLVDQMGQAGILSDHKGSKAREVLITMDEWEHMQAIEEGHVQEEEDLGECFGEGEGEDDQAVATVPDEYAGEFRN